MSTTLCGVRVRYRLSSRSSHILSLPTAAVAQVATGSIVGTVVDSSGQLVPGAQVTVREVNRNTTTTLTTDATGVYTAPFLVPGTYEVSVELQGFKTWIRRGIVLQVNDRLSIDATLEVGTLTESTTVQAESPLVRTDSSEVGTVIEEMAIKELPLNGRNFATLVYLAPGITPGQAGENLSGASTFNPRGASNFNALGSQANSNAWLIDGIDNNEFTFNTVIVAPSVEQVREFKVLSGVFSAEFGRGAGVVSVSTKSGTNQLHGTAYEFLRNDAFDARNFFVRKVRAPDGTLVKDPVPPLDRHQFGGAIGGAVVIPGLYDGHSRTFFFADYAGIKETRGVTTVNTVPTAATRTGDFSNYRDRNGNLIPIYDPLTTRRRPGDGTDRARSVSQQHHSRRTAFNPSAANIASIYPLPNNGSGNFDNYISTPNREITDNAFSGRVDHRLSDNDSFFVRFNYGKFRLDAPQGQANCCLPTPAGGRRPLRSRPVRRRHPEHAADDARRRVQLLEGADARPSSTSCASAMPTPRRSRRSPTTATTPRHRSAFTASTSARSRRACRTSTSRTSPASPADRRSCRSTRASSTTRSRTRWCG